MMSLDWHLGHFLLFFITAAPPVIDDRPQGGQMRQMSDGYPNELVYATRRGGSITTPPIATSATDAREQLPTLQGRRSR